MTTPNLETPAPVTPPATASPVASTPAGTPPPEWRVPDNHPDEWARGKTANELLTLSSQMANALRSPAPPPQNRPPENNGGLPTDETWISRPTDAAAAVADARIAAALTPALAGMQSLVAANAANTRWQAEQQFKDTFAKWGPEVDALMKDVAPEHRTLDNYGKVVKYVRATHEDEIVAERARQMIANGGSMGERSGGAQGGPINSNAVYDATKLPAGLGAVANQKGLTESMVVEFCKKNGWSLERWMTEAQNGKVFTSTGPFTHEMRDDQLGITRQYGE